MNGINYVLMKMFDFWFDHNYSYCHPEKEATEAVKNLDSVKCFCHEWLDYRYGMNWDELADFGLDNAIKVQKELEKAYSFYCLAEF